MYCITATCEPVGRGLSVLVGLRSARAAVVSAESARVLMDRRVWSLSELDSLVSRDPAVSVPRLVQAGVLTDLHREPEEQSPIIAAILGHGQPSLTLRAARCIASHTACLAAHNTPVLVVDCSCEPKRHKTLVDSLGILAREFSTRFVICTRKTAEVLAGRLAATAPRCAAAARFGLLALVKGASSAGAARNLILLMTHGARILSVDDDVCDPVLAGLPSNDWTWTTSDAVERVFPVRSSSPPRHRTNLISAHGDWLGAKLGENGERVVLTHSGLVGDCGAESPWYEIAGNASHRRLTRQVMRGVAQTTITPVRRLMSFAYGLVNQGDVPPFMPMGRNQDGAFAAFLGIYKRGALSCFLPVYVTHKPDPPRDDRAYADLRTLFPRPWRTNDIVAMIAAESAGSLLGVERASHALAAMASDLRNGRSDALMSYVLRQLSAQAGVIESWTGDRRWASDRLCSVSHAELLRDPRPVEWRGHDIHALGDYLDSCSELLVKWREVTAATATIQEWAPPWSCLGVREGVLHVG